MAAIALALTPVYVRESREDAAGRRFDAFGAVTVTASLVALVYAIAEAPDAGWATFRTIGLLAVSAVLMGAFLAWEARARDPLMPLGIFRIRLLTAANIVGFLQAGSLFANFFALTLYLQEVLEY